ncbi:Multidrug resistance protein MdtH [uncultured archaeon]|nr:Multidrug resistance protein MdtH [uncultured archaeon]
MRQFLSGAWSTLLGDRQLLLLCISLFIFYLGGGAVLLLVPILAEKTVGRVEFVGLIMAVPAFISLLLSIPVGSLSDSLGRKNVLLAGFASMILPGIFLSISNDAFLLVVAMAFLGLGYALITTSSRAFVMDFAPRDGASKYFSFINTASSLGTAIGPFLGGILLVGGLQQGTLLIASLFIFTCAFAGVVSLSLRETVKETTSVSKGLKLLSKDGFYFRGFAEYGKLKSIGGVVFGLTFMLTFLDRAVWTFEPLYYNEGMNSYTVGLILSMFIIPYILFEIPGGFLADKYGKFKTLFLGLLVAGFSLILFGSTNSPTVLVAAAFLSTTGLALAWPSISGLLSDESDSHNRGQIVGVWNSSENLGFTLSPILGGLIAGYYQSISKVFTLVGVLFLFACIAVVLFKRSNKIV